MNAFNETSTRERATPGRQPHGHRGRPGVIPGHSCSTRDIASIWSHLNTRRTIPRLLEVTLIGTDVVFAVTSVASPVVAHFRLSHYRIAALPLALRVPGLL